MSRKFYLRIRLDEELQRKLSTEAAREVRTSNSMVLKILKERYEIVGKPREEDSDANKS